MKLNRLLPAIFSAVTWLGTPFFYVPVIAYLFTVQQLLAVRLALTMLIIELSGGIIKLIYPKDRPTPQPKKTLRQKWDAGSFPSIHTARAVAIAIFLSALNTSWQFALAGTVLAAAVGYSRICLRKHYTLDVIGGLLLGTFISALLLATNHGTG